MLISWSFYRSDMQIMKSMVFQPAYWWRFNWYPGKICFKRSHLMSLAATKIQCLINKFIFPIFTNNNFFSSFPKFNLSRSGHFSVCIYLIIAKLARHDTRSIFKWSTIDLNSEFLFPLTGCLTKAKEPSLPYLLIAGKRGEQMDSCLYQEY